MSGTLHLTPAGVSLFGRVGVEVYSGRRHECETR